MGPLTDELTKARAELHAWVADLQLLRGQCEHHECGPYYEAVPVVARRTEDALARYIAAVRALTAPPPLSPIEPTMPAPRDTEADLEQLKEQVAHATTPELRKEAREAIGVFEQVAGQEKAAEARRFFGLCWTHETPTPAEVCA